MSEGGLEGESPVFQEGALSLQGLPSPAYLTSIGTEDTWVVPYNIVPYTSAEIPPAGAPSGFDSAAIVTLALAITWRCRSAQNDTWVVCCVSCNILIRQSNIHPNRNDTRVVPPRSKTNFLPFLSGSGESENVRISLAECGSEQPEFVARNTATPKSVPQKERGKNPPLVQGLEGS